MNNVKVRRIVMIGLFTALTCAATMIIRIPSPTGGYINPGDSIVLLSAFLLGPLGGALAAAMGSGFADLLSGYAAYAPATFIIKGTMALCAGLIYQRIKLKNKNLTAIIAGVAAEIIMILGYFLFTSTVIGIGAAALVEVPGNVVQGIFGIAAGTLINTCLIRIQYVSETISSPKRK